MDTDEKQRFLNFISPFISDHRKTRIDEVLDERTRHITVVLEDIYQSQNASAVVRTCECLGIQDIHVIEKRNKYKTNRDVLRGSGKWVNLLRYESPKPTEDCFANLRSNGYKIVGASPDANITLEELDVANRLAIVFGTELEGLSEYASGNVDEVVKIPMFGFTESFNLSVSAAIMMSSLMHKVRSSLNSETWKLSAIEQLDLKGQWYLKVVRNPDKLEKEFYRLTSKVK